MDLKLLFLINRQWTGPVLDRLMALLSSFDAWIPPLVILVLLLLWRGGFRGRALVICAALIVGINDGVISRTLKQVVNRPRPHQSVDDVRVVDLARAKPRMLALLRPPKVGISQAAADFSVVKGHSFPSSHTINIMSVALLVSCFYRRWGWLAFLPALGVAYSRIYTGSHWPSDVLASIFLGLGLTLVFLSALEWLWKTSGGRLLPAAHAQHPSLIHS